MEGFAPISSPEDAILAQPEAAFGNRGLLVPRRTSTGITLAEYRLDARGRWQATPVVGSLPKTISGSLFLIPAIEAPYWRLGIRTPKAIRAISAIGMTALTGYEAHPRQDARFTDLDRDRIPELWLFRPARPGSAVGDVPLLVEIADADDDTAIELDRDTARLLDEANGVVAWDFNEDYFEDIVVLRSHANLQVLDNRGGFDLRSAERDLAPGTRFDHPVATELRLGPQRGDHQWALAWHRGQTGGPLLLYRDHRAFLFVAHPSTGKLRDWRAIDARILDVDADGRDDLIWIARRAEGRPQDTFVHRWVLPKRPRDAATPLGEPSSVPGARKLRIGDLDADAVPDLVVLRNNAAPLAWRNESLDGRAPKWFGVTLSDPDLAPAIGSYLELWSTTDRLLRMRWPPQDSADQRVIWLSWENAAGQGTPEVRVTWPDGNAQTIDDPKPGTRIEVRR